MENPHIIAISETVRVRWHDNISRNIRSDIFVFRFLTSIYSSLLDGYPSKPGFSLVNCDKNYARVILLGLFTWLPNFQECRTSGSISEYALDYASEKSIDIFQSRDCA